MLTIKEAAAAVKGVSEHTIRKLVAQGKLWCKIRYWQNLRDVTDTELAAVLQVSERTLHEYDKNTKNITLEKVDSFLYMNGMELADLMTL